MRRTIPWLLLALFVTTFLWLVPDPERDEPVVVAAAPRVPATHAENPANAPAELRDLAREHEVLLVQFVPADREPAPGQAERIRVAARFAADFFHRDLADKGLATEGLDFVFDGGRPTVELVRGSRPAEWYHGEEARAEVHGHVASPGDAVFWSVYHEVSRALGPASRRIFVIFSDTHVEGEPCFREHGNVARGVLLSRDGGALVVSGWYADEGWCAADAYEQLLLFDDRTPVEGCSRADGTRPRPPRFDLVEGALGGLTHELGHALGLLHDFRARAEDLMGMGGRHFRPGYRGPGAEPPHLWLSRENVLLLRRSPYLFDDVDPTDTSEPTLVGSLGELRAGATEVPLELIATDDAGLAAVIVVSLRHDTLIAGFEADGPRLELRQSVPHQALEPGPLDIGAIAIDRGGNRKAIALRREVQ